MMVMMVIIAMAGRAPARPILLLVNKLLMLPMTHQKQPPHPILRAFLLGEVGRRRGWRPRGSPRELVKGCALRKFYIHRCGAFKPTSEVNHRLDPFIFPAINPKNSEPFCQRKWVYLGIAGICNRGPANSGQTIDKSNKQKDRNVVFWMGVGRGCLNISPLEKCKGFRVMAVSCRLSCRSGRSLVGDAVCIFPRWGP